MNVEELQSKILELTEQLAELKANEKTKDELLQTKDKEFEELKNSTNERITELQEHNQKLFLKVTTPIDEVEVKKEFHSKLLEGYENILNDEELEQLKQFEEVL